MPARRSGTLRNALVIVILVGLAGGAGGALWGWSTVTRSVDHASADQIITIEQGTGTQTIIARLAEAGIVRHPTALKIYLKLEGRGRALKAGDYKFPSPISAIDAIGRIERAEVVLERVTIPEGFNRFEIAQTLAARTGKAAEGEFLRLTEDQTPIEQIAPTVRDLEGYLFPDTYNYSATTTPQELVRAMVDRFKEVFTPEWTTRASELGLTLHQVVTLASIIEEEARVAEERPLVASVFMNRLERGMPLASDPTFIYAAVLAHDYDGNPNQPRHRARFSSYNTYLVPGLPPGPISSPGRASLEAALYPASSDYLYFVVSGTDGRHKFSRTSAEHELAVSEYRRQQRELRER